MTIITAPSNPQDTAPRRRTAATAYPIFLSDIQPALAKFSAFVDQRGGDRCWFWMGSRDKNGYGSMYIGRRCYGAHRLAWVYANGDLAEALTIDHLCYNPSCVNPSHLEPVTIGENSRRRRIPDTCKRGHPLDGTRKTSGYTVRICLTCERARHITDEAREARRERNHRYQARKRAQAGAA